MMPDLASPPELRASRSFLRQNLKAGSGDINPKHFANASKELGIGFSGVAAVLARIYSGGQNQSFYREQALEADLSQGK
jgi:hypothetical protein